MRTLHCLLLGLFYFSILEARQAPAVPPASPVDHRIAAARKHVGANPKSAQAYNELAFALIRKGRDFRDEALYTQAGDAVAESLRLSPENYDAQKLRVAVLLGLNEPAQALKLETELNHKTPDDIVGWALLVDAHAALGDYDQAEHAAQWVLDLRPGSSLGFEKAAELREMFGDSEGAIEFWDEANRRTSMNDADQKAWLLTRKARLVLASGNTKASSDLLDAAMRIFPDSQLALAGLAQVRLAEKNYTEALALLEKRYRCVPTAENRYDWAEALAESGQAQAAAVEFKNFEQQARAENAKHKSAVLQLISYYSDRKPDPGQALTLASSEVAVRHDSPTLAAYAWALYRNGRFSDAKLQMDKALAVGVRDAVYFCHAESIAAMAKDIAATEHYSKELSSMPGNSCASNTSLQSANQPVANHTNSEAKP
jgi:tetratricopeptide (TPR) repeat protein